MIDVDWPEEVLLLPGYETVKSHGRTGAKEQVTWRGPRVRIGVHCGPFRAECDDDAMGRTTFHGLGPQLATELCEAAHAGQILAQSATSDLIWLPSGSTPALPSVENGDDGDESDSETGPLRSTRSAFASIGSVASLALDDEGDREAKVLLTVLGDFKLPSTDDEVELVQAVPRGRSGRTFPGPPRTQTLLEEEYEKTVQENEQLQEEMTVLADSLEAASATIADLQVRLEALSETSAGKAMDPAVVHEEVKALTAKLTAAIEHQEETEAELARVVAEHEALKAEVESFPVALAEREASLLADLTSTKTASMRDKDNFSAAVTDLRRELMLAMEAFTECDDTAQILADEDDAKDVAQRARKVSAAYSSARKEVASARAAMTVLEQKARSMDEELAAARARLMGSEQQREQILTDFRRALADVVRLVRSTDLDATFEPGAGVPDDAADVMEGIIVDWQQAIEGSGDAVRLGAELETARRDYAQMQRARLAEAKLKDERIASLMAELEDA